MPGGAAGSGATIGAGGCAAGCADGQKVLVLGAGVNGLSSAVRIQEACPGVKVTIMAFTFSPETTSDGAAGLWETFVLGTSNPELVAELSKETYDYMINLSLSPLAATVRTQLVCGFHFSDETIQKEFDFKDTVDSYRPASATEISRIPGAKDGRFFTSVVMDVTRYLKFLVDKFIANGGVMVQKRLDSLEDLSPDWDVVVNCTGMGSFDLFNDARMKPVRGQVFRVRAPWIKHFSIFEYKVNGRNHVSYLVPNSDIVVVGGTMQEGFWDEAVSKVDADDIWERVVKIFPNIKHAKILNSWAGLRPKRDAIRLEQEVVEIGEEKRKLRVVHNYGHGGAGITLHWGCARKAAEMVCTFLQEVELGRGESGNCNYCLGKL